jgi:UDP-N-acetylglucosamine 2-epimerase
VVVTGQHKEQLDQVLKVFDIVPDVNLNIMQHGQTLKDITVRALEGLDADFQENAADICLAQGDTTTTFVAGLAAFYHKIRFGHVEAGLRTGNKYDPFPEEMNRMLAAPLATWHFAPTPNAKENLIREGVDRSGIHVTGNTSIDALKWVASSGYKVDDPVISKLLHHGNPIVLITAHRRENWGDPMRSIAAAVAELAARFTDTSFVVALHRNPIVREILCPILSNIDNVFLIEPPDYAPFVMLMKAAKLILTDSGGVQEEAPTLGVPVLVLRNTTERQEGVDAGTARLIGTNTVTIVGEATQLLTDPRAHLAMAHAENPYGDGIAAELIADILSDSVI